LSDYDQRLRFYDGLSDEIKDRLMNMPEATTLTTLADQAIQAELRLHARRPHTAGRRQPWSASPSPAAPMSPSPLTGDAMEIDHVRRAPLTADEKDRRRRENLCLYCGTAGHLVENCTARPGRSAGKAAGRQ
jgi:hypothetical protein